MTTVLYYRVRPDHQITEVISRHRIRLYTRIQLY